MTENDVALQQYMKQLALTLDMQNPMPSEQPMVLLAPWTSPPPGFQPFDFLGTRDTPLVGTGDTTVLSFQVPRGWDGVIKRISHNYTGGGFPQGSGGIEWRILYDGAAFKNYERILFEFGSLSNPRATDGLLVYENQLISYVVNVAGTGGFIPSASTQIICTMAGYFWPRRDKQ